MPEKQEPKALKTLEQLGSVSLTTRVGSASGFLSIVAAFRIGQRASSSFLFSRAYCLQHFAGSAKCLAVSARNGFCPVTQGRAFSRFLPTGPARLGIPPHRRTAPAASCECRRPARSAAIYGPSPRPGASGGTAFAAVPRPPPSTPCRRVWQPSSPGGEGQPHVTKLPLHAAPPPLPLFAHRLDGRARPAESGQRVPVHRRPCPAGVEAAGRRLSCPWAA